LSNGCEFYDMYGVVDGETFKKLCGRLVSNIYQEKFRLGGQPLSEGYRAYITLSKTAQELDAYGGLSALNAKQRRRIRRIISGVRDTGADVRHCLETFAGYSPEQVINALRLEYAAGSNWQQGSWSCKQRRAIYDYLYRSKEKYFNHFGYWDTLICCIVLGVYWCRDEGILAPAVYEPRVLGLAYLFANNKSRTKSKAPSSKARKSMFEAVGAELPAAPPLPVVDGAAAHEAQQVPPNRPKLWCPHENVLGPPQEEHEAQLTPIMGVSYNEFAVAPPVSMDTVPANLEISDVSHLYNTTDFYRPWCINRMVL
jgi:hypothetical protein